MARIEFGGRIDWDRGGTEGSSGNSCSSCGVRSFPSRPVREVGEVERSFWASAADGSVVATEPPEHGSDARGRKGGHPWNPGRAGAGSSEDGGVLYVCRLCRDLWKAVADFTRNQDSDRDRTRKRGRDEYFKAVAKLAKRLRTAVRRPVLRSITKRLESPSCAPSDKRRDRLHYHPPNPSAECRRGTLK